jgi:hypothetical protein
MKKTSMVFSPTIRPELLVTQPNTIINESSNEGLY